MDMMCKLSSIILFNSIGKNCGQAFGSFSPERKNPTKRPTTNGRICLASREIEEIQHLEVGEDFKTTPKSFDVALSVEFDDREALSAFSVHPEYVPVLDLIHEICSEYAVVDMEIESN